MPASEFSLILLISFLTILVESENHTVSVEVFKVRH